LPWPPAAICSSGVAVAFHRYEIAIVLSALNLATLRLGTSLKDARSSAKEAGD
jgi:hypothetical protein